MLTDLRSLTFSQIQTLCSNLGWEPYRSRQLYGWLWRKGVKNFEAMTNLSKAQREQLAKHYSLGSLRPIRIDADEDGTIKFAWQLADGEIVESVFLPNGARRTVCVSSQVGCGLGCRFCATARLGLRRNLQWHEIAMQVLAVRDFVAAQQGGQIQPVLTNVVFMGMGEPLLNLDAVSAAVDVISDDEAIGIGARHITVSTSGIPTGIASLAKSALQTRLAISLNAADDDIRSRLMPINRQYPLTELMAAVRHYAAERGKRVTIEYVMIAGINDRDRDIRQLALLLKGLPCKVNLIPLNPFPGCSLRPSSQDRVDDFARALWSLVGAVTIRRSKGSQILAGCGQLGAATKSRAGLSNSPTHIPPPQP